MAHWLYLFFGLGDGGSSQYLFWSGAGADLTELTLPVGLVVFLRKHNCETSRCWRLGRHQWANPDTGLTHIVCRRHHPDGKQIINLQKVLKTVNKVEEV